MALRRSSLKPYWPYALNKQSTQSTGLLAWYPGGPAGTTRLYDLSGNGRHGTLTNFDSPFSKTSGWVAGIDGGFEAIRLDGVDNYINLGSNFGGALAQISYGGWFKQISHSGFPHVISRFGNNSVLDSTDAFLLHLDSFARFRAVLAGPNISATSNGSFTGVQTHCMVTYNGASLKIYINGRLDVSTAGTGAINAAAGVNCLVGYGNDPVTGRRGRSVKSDTATAVTQTGAPAIRTAIGMATNDLDTQLDAILAASGGGGGGGVIGAGSSLYTANIDDGSNPIDGAAVWVSSDAAGTSIIAGTRYTNGLGVTTFMLDPGDYFLWVQHGRYNGTNPTAIEVT